MINCLLSQGLLIPIDWPCITSILRVYNPSGAYGLVQDLCFINEAIIPIYPVVTNPYTLLSNILSTTSHFTVLDLKDAFFTVRLYPEAYFLFSFT